jgi:ketosteroid isomerase-like protein
VSWLLESPWPAIWGGIIAEAVLVAIFLSTGRVRLVAWMALAAAISGGFVLLEWLVVTEREQIVATIFDAAEAIEAGDIDRALSFVAEDAKELRDKAGRAVNHRPRQVRVGDDMKIEIRDDVEPPQAQVILRAMVVLGGGYDGALPFHVTAWLRKEDGKWRVYRADERLGLR